MRPPPLTLAGGKRQALAQIDQLAGEVRLRYITEVPGQQAVYMTKMAEAKAYKQAPVQLLATPGPHLLAEADALGVTPAALADQIITAAQAWMNVQSPAIEARRIAGKAAVQAATTPAAVQAALQAAKTALNSVAT